MVKVNIISGFLGAGKTTLIKKLLSALAGEKVVLLENEYGDVSVDGSFMKDAGITVTELSNGCICCSLVGDLQKAIDELIGTYQPDRLLIEPSGVGKLSEIAAAIEEAKERHDLEISGCATVVDAKKCKMHMKNFGEFYLDQIKTADTVIFSRTQLMDADKVEAARALVEENHAGVRIITTPWDDLSAEGMLQVIEQGKPLVSREDMEHAHHHHDEHCTCGCHDHEHHHHHDHDEHCECGCHDHEHHHHHDHDEHCECGCHDHEHHHHHDHDEHCECGCHDHEHHHHHDHDEHCECGCHDHEHHHHHDHDEHCECGCHDHEHHHHHDHDEHCACGHDHHHHHGHDADEVFTSIGAETARRYEQSDIAAMLDALSDEEKYGHVLRAKGVLQSNDGSWFQFDYVPGESQFRPGTADYTGRLCVIGAHIDEKALKELFRV